MSQLHPVEARPRASGALDPLFRPRGIAVVGASANPHKLGSALCRSLRGFDGVVAAVNPHVPGMYRSLADAAAEAPVDLVMICVPAPGCPGVLAEAAAAGAGAAVISGGGFAEAGGDGPRLQAEIAAIAAATGIRVLGPNTSGFVLPRSGLTASFVPGVSAVPAGRVAIVAASGGMNHALAFSLAEAGHGVSLAVGLGNAVDISAMDVLDYLSGDETTAAVALHVESVVDGRGLVSAVRRLTSTRPVVALVVGRHDISAFAASHTGALATSWRIARAALAQAGAVLVEDERELVDAVGALSTARLRPACAPGVGVVTAQAGPGLLILDELRGRRAPVPELTAATRGVLDNLLLPMTFQRNPVDTGRPGPSFGAVLAAVGADPGVDLIAGYALDEPDAFDLASAVTGQARGVPVVFGVGGFGTAAASTRRALRGAGVATATGPRSVATAAFALLADARAQHRRLLPAATRSAPPVAVAPGEYDEASAKDLIDHLGIPTMPRRACRGRAEAHLALAELPGAVAVKLLSPGILHKTEVGGVCLGVSSATELDQALDRLEAAGASRFLVESMAPPGIDLIVGARRDPVFGPVVLVGLGGAAAEVLADVAVRLVPLSPVEAHEMPAELAAAALLDGWRGGPTLDRSALAEVLVALGSVVSANPHLEEIEINPLRVLPDGLIALDAVVRTRED